MSNDLRCRCRWSANSPAAAWNEPLRRSGTWIPKAAANLRENYDVPARTPPAVFGARVTNGRYRVGVGGLNLGNLPTDCLQASKKTKKVCCQIHSNKPLCVLAERVGFEPTVVLLLRLISSQVHSTTLPPLRSKPAILAADFMAYGVRTWMPPMYGHSASGTCTEPSARW